jgi:hypothetical protein
MRLVDLYNIPVSKPSRLTLSRLTAFFGGYHAALFTTRLQILDAFLGKQFLSAAKQANKMSRRLTGGKGITVPGISSKLLGTAVGGLFGIFMVACGPSMHPDLPHLKKCQHIVTK